MSLTAFFTNKSKSFTKTKQKICEEFGALEKVLGGGG